MDQYTKDRIRTGLDSLHAIRHFVPPAQRKSLTDLIRTSEEREVFIEKMEDLALAISTMPPIYGQDGKGDDAICYLHYFGGSYDGYLIEKDLPNPEAGDDEQQWQAYGYGRWEHMADMAEKGYICLPEIFTSKGIELDLHFNAMQLSEIKAKFAKRDEPAAPQPPPPAQDPAPHPEPDEKVGKDSMKQQGNGINPGNIQHFADSAKNAIQLGQRQFFTPPDLSAALCSVFQRVKSDTACDLMAGSHHLLAASKRSHKVGIDVDERSASGFNIYQADVTRWYPLAHAAGLSMDLLLLNPPFSLQWYLDRLAPLATSTAPGVKQAYAAALASGDTMDSTLATYLIALDRLTASGEGMMICNADTARRLIGDPTDAQPSALLRNCWCWLDIPGAVYENISTPFPTAVLYFSASHGTAAPKDRGPLYLHSPSGDPGTVEKTLATAVTARQFAFCGRTITDSYQCRQWTSFKPLWDAVRSEYHALHHGAKPDFNLLLGENGTIRAFLDPFRKAAYHHNRDLLEAFRHMNGETPAALVVQQVSRAALKHAIHCGAWRVQPELVKAVDDAIGAYEAVRAPFYTPNPVQSLGWLDEEKVIECNREGIKGFRPGQSYAISSWIEDTAWNGSRNNMNGDKEKLAYTGRELVIEIEADAGKLHHFHVRRPKPAGAAKDDETDYNEAPAMDDDKGVTHHHVQSLIDHFAIPIPRDVAQTNPTAYLANLERLQNLEDLINQPAA